METALLDDETGAEGVVSCRSLESPPHRTLRLTGPNSIQTRSKLDLNSIWLGRRQELISRESVTRLQGSKARHIVAQSTRRQCISQRTAKRSANGCGSVRSIIKSSKIAHMHRRWVSSVITMPEV